MLRYPFFRFCVLLIFTSTFLTRCTFDSDEEYFNTLTLPDESALGVSVKNTVDLAKYNAGDTIDLYGSTSFSFSIDGTHGVIVSAQVFLSNPDESWRHISTGTTNSFQIYPWHLTSSGVFILKLDLTTRTGSGSLADAVGAEKFNITQKWVVRIDLSPPQQPLPTLTIEDGFLTMQWSAYSKPNFQSYVVRRRLYSGASQTFEIKDKKITRWRDENYVGGHTVPIEYSVAIVSEVGTTTSVPIPRIDPIRVSFSFNILDSIVTAHWEPTKFYGTFKDYKFSPSQGAPELTNVNDTTLTYKLSTIRFGDESTVSLTVRSKSPATPAIPEYSNYGTCKLGTPLPVTAADKVMFNSYLNSAVALTEDKKLLELDEQLQPVREIATLANAYMKMPYPGNYVYSYADGNIHRLKLEDNSKVLYDYSNTRLNTVASNGLICTEYFRPRVQIRPGQFTLPVWRTRAVDPAGGRDVYYEDSNTTDLNAVISEDGKFIWANNKSVFRINGTTSALVGTLTDAGSFIGFRQDNSDEIMFRDGYKINFYDTNTLTLIRTINPPSTYYGFVSYDLQSKDMLWAGSGARIYTVNIETGVITKSIDIAWSVSGKSMYIVNGLLISDGEYIKVK